MKNMRQNRERLASVYIILFVLTSLSLISATIFNVFANLALYINLLFVAIGILVYSSIERKKLMYIVILTVYVMMTLLITNGGIGSVLVLILPLLMLSVFSNLQVSTVQKKRLVKFCALVVMLLYVYSVSYGKNYIQYILIKINPNTLGMFVMFLFMIVNIYGDFSRTSGKVAHGILFILALWSMYNYRSRGTMLALSFYMLLVILSKKMFGRKRFFFLVAMIIVGGTVFPFIYLYMYESGYTLNMFGKSLYTGREVLWANMFNLMKDDVFKILFGMGSRTELWGHSLNVHNNYFNIIVNFGFVGYVMYYGFLLSTIWKVSKYMNNSTVMKGVSMFVAGALLLGFTETTTLWPILIPVAFWGLVVASAECRELSC